MKTLLELRPGDMAHRMIAGGKLLVVLRVTGITDDHIICGPWVFDRTTGAEIDDDLHWGPKYGFTGTYLHNFDKRMTK